jgi:hypothetical protein
LWCRVRPTPISEWRAHRPAIDTRAAGQSPRLPGGTTTRKVAPQSRRVKILQVAAIVPWPGSQRLGGGDWCLCPGFWLRLANRALDDSGAGSTRLYLRASTERAAIGLPEESRRLISGDRLGGWQHGPDRGGGSAGGSMAQISASQRRRLVFVSRVLGGYSSGSTRPIVLGWPACLLGQPAYAASPAIRLCSMMKCQRLISTTSGCSGVPICWRGPNAGHATVLPSCYGHGLCGLIWCRWAALALTADV